MKAALFGGLALVGAVNAKRDYGIPTVHVGMDQKGESVDIPLVGIGSWLYNETQTYDATKTAFTLPKLPYRHIDTAWDYQNQKGIGRCLKDLDLPRESYFVTTKVEGGLNASHTMAEAESDLSDLGLDYVDLMLLHFPCDLSTAVPHGSAAQRQEQWRVMEELYTAGKVRSIGVSHYCARHLEDLFKIATVKPMINQVQYHVGMGTAPENATDITFKYAKDHGVVYQSFSPLCGPCCMGMPDNCTLNRELITGDLVSGIGAKYGKSGAQVSLKWQTQQGIPVIPKSSSATHQAENIDLFDWELSAEDMQTLHQATSPPVGGAPSPVDSGDCGLP